MLRTHLFIVFALLTLTVPASANPVDLTAWPDPDTISGSRGTPVTYPSHSPFTL